MISPNWELELSKFLDRHLPPGKNRDSCPPQLADSIRYSLLAPGKRIRPRLAFESGRLVGLPDGVSTRVGIAIECIHCFTLIHDDLPSMDNSDTRRGQPSNHKMFGEAIALLAGDSLMALAFDAWMEIREWLPADRLFKGLAPFVTAIGARGVCAGQAAEMQLTKNSSLEDLHRVHAQKTGALFAAPIMIPCDLADIPKHDDRYRALDHFSQALGSAFQVADDLDDAVQDFNSKTQSYALHNVLSHLPKHQAAHDSFTELKKAELQMIEAWGQTFGLSALLKIANEVAAKLRVD